MKKIVSYNLNGIRAALKKDFALWLKDYQPDMLCIQETKAQEDQIDKEVFEELGYHSYWYSAQKKGYSGVGILTKEKPDNVIYGMNIEKYDNEGRFIRADYGDISLISVYHPSGSSGDTRQNFKIQWLNDFRTYISDLRKTRKKLIISGDYNICHKPIDINRPEKHKKSSGFLPEEREWMDTFVGDGFIDSFRYFCSDAERYSWWSYRANARAKNLGWRIDYHLVTENLEKNLKGADILANVKHSDHCPILIEITFDS